MKHRFIVVIPVADRPRHIQACLDSLQQLLRRFPCEREVAVLLADDSMDAVNVAVNREIAQRVSAAGLPTLHFGSGEQFDLVAPVREALTRIAGDAPRERFGHKGQGAMRNIAYLKLAELLRDSDDDVLVWSVDSDQEFCVKIVTPEGDRDVYAVDYFHGLDAIFTRSDALVLTGKVVGDPPVSPAVMTGNFLADVQGFLQGMAARDPLAACSQHGWEKPRGGDAAYHDMAELFGFRHAGDASGYPCPLEGGHTEADCFAYFAARVNSFFYGEHPTRVSYYEAAELFDTLQPARTVYAGNYVFRPAALKYFVPFAHLRLRMSGPTLGRILKAEIGPRFVSANLPMLHKRTVETGGRAEFRPGIETAHQIIDMSGEFERQFYGDVMLFAVERLAAEARIGGDALDVLDAVRADMLAKYNARQRAILERLGEVEALLNDPARWWNRAADHAAAVGGFAAFVANVRRNFAPDSAGHVRINAADAWTKWRADLGAAIARYPADRATWENLVCGV